MTNSISPRATSILSSATTALGSAKEAFKAMADAATNAEKDTSADRTEAPAPGAGKGRRGVSLDRYA